MDSMTPQEFTDAFFSRETAAQAAASGPGMDVCPICQTPTDDWATIIIDGQERIVCQPCRDELICGCGG
jgi:hypothetical protein